MKRNGPASIIKSPALVTATAAKNAGLLALAMCFTLTSCGTPGVRPSSLPASWHTAPSGPVVLSEGDTVKINLPGAPEFSGVQKIRADGKLSLPVIGEVQAAGKTLLRLQSDVSARYRQQQEITNSTVVVTLEASGSPVSVGGGVASPTRFVLDRPTTLIEALLAAGGKSEMGDMSRVRIVRVSNGRVETVVVDMRGTLKGTESTQIYLKPGDSIDVGQF